MPRKNEHSQVREAELTAWYQWEFLRRNPEYGRDYDKFVRKFGTWFREHGYFYDDTMKWSPDDWRFFGAAIAPRAQKLCEKWQILEPYPPDWKFSDSGDYEYRPGEHVSLCTGYAPDKIKNFWRLLRDRSQQTREAFEAGLPTNTSVPASKADRIRYYSLRLDFAQPLKVLLAHAKREISPRKKRYDNAHPKPEKVPKLASARRRRLHKYEQYLKVWDLKIQGLSYAAIGFRLFDDDLDPTQRVKNYYRATKLLILGGYRELR
jgi:hypothetical protein